MKTQILHNEKGTIIAIAKVIAPPKGFRGAGMISGSGQKLIEVELSPEDEKLSLDKLHAIYRVDMATSKLVKI